MFGLHTSEKITLRNFCPCWVSDRSDVRNARIAFGCWQGNVSAAGIYKKNARLFLGGKFLTPSPFFVRFFPQDPKILQSLRRV